MPIKAILGGTLVNGLGTLRNRFSDAHADEPPTDEHPRIRPSPRHASLAVNVAGAVATFLVETYQERGKIDPERALHRETLRRRARPGAVVAPERDAVVLEGSVAPHG